MSARALPDLLAVQVVPHDAGRAVLHEPELHPLPDHHRRAYLSEREDAPAVMGAMAALFAAADGPLRRHLLRWGGMPIGDAPAPDAASRPADGTIVGHE